jgi:hypothetical protein
MGLPLLVNTVSGRLRYFGVHEVQRAWYQYEEHLRVNEDSLSSTFFDAQNAHARTDTTTLST